MPQVNTTEYVILLHGLTRSDRSMKKFEQALSKAGYLTININYPSTKHQIEVLAKKTISKALAQCPEYSKIHFVTHSLGGILVRQYLHQNTINNLGRVVMLGPPNKGSQVVDRFSKTPGFKLLNGPAGMQLGTKKDSIPNKLGPAFFELGIIAGTRSVNPLLSLIIPGSDDGKVSVESTKIIGMSDHIELPVTHPFMMNNEAVISQVLHFLKKGVFSRSLP